MYSRSLFKLKNKKKKKTVLLHLRIKELLGLEDYKNNHCYRPALHIRSINLHSPSKPHVAMQLLNYTTLG